MADAFCRRSGDYPKDAPRAIDMKAQPMIAIYRTKIERSVRYEAL